MVGGGLAWWLRAEPTGAALFPSTLARQRVGIGHLGGDRHGVSGLDQSASCRKTMMSTLIPVLGVVVAVAAAVRSTWSPCGLSMLSSITPFGERSRGHRYSVTAAWFVVGA